MGLILDAEEETQARGGEAATAGHSGHEGEKTTIGASASPPPPQLPQLWLGVGDAILFWSLHHNGSLNPLSTHQGQPTHELVRLLYQLHVQLQVGLTLCYDWVPDRLSDR